MRYKTKSGKSLSDYQSISDISRTVTSSVRNKYPFLLGIFIYLFEYFINIGSYISRSFLRAKLGERTFGITTILFSYLFAIIVQNLIFIYSDLSRTDEWQSASGIVEKIAMMNIAFEKFDLVFLFLLYDNYFQSLETEVYVYIVLIGILSLFHLNEVRERKEKGKALHSYYRGDSIFFGWLKGKKILGHEITITHIWMIIEPLFVYFVALMLEFLWFDFISLILKTSAFCLFIEEYRVKAENRQFELDLIDNQLEGEYAKKLQKETQDKIRDNNPKVKESYRYKAEIAGSADIGLHQRDKASNHKYIADLD